MPGSSELSAAAQPISSKGHEKGQRIGHTNKLRRLAIIVELEVDRTLVAVSMSPQHARKNTTSHLREDHPVSCSDIVENEARAGLCQHPTLNRTIDLIQKLGSSRMSVGCVHSTRA